VTNAGRLQFTEQFIRTDHRNSSTQARARIRVRASDNYPA
jgi:hypothetical protein